MLMLMTVQEVWGSNPEADGPTQVSILSRAVIEKQKLVVHVRRAVIKYGSESLSMLKIAHVAIIGDVLLKRQRNFLLAYRDLDNNLICHSIAALSAIWLACIGLSLCVN